MKAFLKIEAQRWIKPVISNTLASVTEFLTLPREEGRGEGHAIQNSPLDSSFQFGK
jgi:hypothetical protein